MKCFTNTCMILVQEHMQSICNLPILVYVLPWRVQDVYNIAIKLKIQHIWCIKCLIKTKKLITDILSIMIKELINVVID